MSDDVTAMVASGRMRWFAVNAKAHQEHFAATNLGRLGAQILLPQIKIERLVRGAARIAFKPLFPGYFFARFCAENLLESVNCSRGVLRVVSSGGFPLPVEDEIVQDIQNRIEEDGLVRIGTPHLRPGLRVSVRCGPLEGLMGRVERELDDRKRVAILLETLSQARVLIDRRWIEAEAA